MPAVESPAQQPQGTADAADRAPTPAEIAGERAERAADHDGGRGPMGLLRRRLSVLHLMVVLTLIPTLGLPVFSWSFIHDRQERADAAGRVEEGLQGVAHLDALRAALENETASQILARALASINLTGAERNLVPAEMLASDPKVVQQTTDRAIAATLADRLLAVPGGRAQAAKIAQAVTDLRTAGNRAAAQGGMQAAFISLLVTQRQYNDLLVQLSAMERTALHRISSGYLGTGSAGILAANAQIRAVGDLVLAVSQQHTLYFQLFTPAVTTAQLTQLADSTGAVDTLADNLEPFLSPKLVPEWKALLVEPRITIYRKAVADYLVDSRNGTNRALTLDAGSIVKVSVIGQGALEFLKRMSSLMAGAVAQGVAQAHHDQTEATTRARSGLLGALGTLIATVVVLLLVGGAIRRRLGDLAHAAQRLSAGRFEPMAVRGPREVAFASEGLNDAVRSLREITMKAGLIAQGDLEAPALEEPSPGPLGAAMHASFERVVAVMREREQLQQQLHFEATHDSLTGLPNRAEAESQLITALREARAANIQIGLLFIDLDHFKAVNDTYGHHAGDHVLCVSAERMQDQLRGGDTTCRLGGDEFVVVLKDVGADAASAAGARIVAALGEPVHYRGSDLRIGASVGIAMWPGPGYDDDPVDADLDEADDVTYAKLAENLLGRADKAVYRAKAAGRNAAVF